MKLTGYQVYCGTYGKYNEGSLAGKWMDLCDYDDADEFFEACRDLHADESDPEFMFQDTDCPVSVFNGEPDYNDIKKFYELADQVDSYSGIDADDVLSILMQGYNPDNVAVLGDESDFEAYCDELLEEMNIPEWVMYYFDYAKYYEECGWNYIQIELSDGKTAWLYN